MAPKTSEMVISYRGLKNLVCSGLEAVESGAAIAPGLPADPVADAAMVAGVEAALNQLRMAADDPHAPGGPEILAALDSRPASLLQSFMAECAAEGKANLIPLGSGGFEAQFDGQDAIGWAASLRSWWRKYLDKHDFLAPPAEPQTIKNGARLAMLGDWGTGLYGAPVCARSIAEAKSPYDVLIHLGDVYYAGTESEVEGRFLNVWPKVSNAISRAINSNHEMYSGGNAYFRQTLPAFQQSSSVFALRNDHWLLIGLDSAYEGNDREGGKLSDTQAGWVTKLVNDGTANDQRVILFSHHQPFSLYDSQGPQLAKFIEGSLAAHKIFAWYWGHEHRCVLYERHPDWQMFGRCVGHSGYPYFRDIFPGALNPKNNGDGSRWITLAGRRTAPTGMVLDGPNQYIRGYENKYGPHGYLTLELSDDHINETVHSASGDVLNECELR
jgi:hypothetical protein